jgi:uncharacterized membrane protein
MSDSVALPLPAGRITNNFWWIVVIIAIVAVTLIALVCISRHMQFGTYIVGGHAWYGTKIYIGCK